MSGGRAARVRAQAKVNLFLRILAREESGYHQLETLFCRLELADVVTVRVTDGERRLVTCRGPELPREGLGPPEQNLAYRAAAAYAEAAAGWPAGVEILVEKHIPVGGGLGGGSADAGAVLRALDALSPAPLGDAQLLALAGRIGADVPFLTAKAPLALAWGRGERMLALPPLPWRDVLLCCFPFGVNTAAAYRWLAKSRAGAPPAAPSLIPADALGSWARIASLSQNDFESVVSERHPEIAATIADFDDTRDRIAEMPNAVAGPMFTRMSGSGSTVFVVYDAGATTVEDGDVPGVRLVRTRTARRVEEVSIVE